MKFLRRILCFLRGHTWSRLTEERYRYSYKRNRKKKYTHYHTTCVFNCVVCGSKSKEIRLSKVDEWKKKKRFEYR